VFDGGDKAPRHAVRQDGGGRQLQRLRETEIGQSKVA